MAAVPFPAPSPPSPPSPAAGAGIPFELRLATQDDFDAYMDAFEAVAAEGRWLGAEAPVDREARRATFERAVAGDNSTLFLADAGGAVVGAAYASVSGGIVDLGMFVVDGRRGAGVGSALLEAVIGWARQVGAHKVSLAVWPTNHPAIGLYARYGFRIEGTRRRHWRRRSGALWDAVLMGLILDHDTPGGPGPARPERPSIVMPAGGLVGSAGGLRIVLREWHRADIPALVSLIEDPEILRWLDLIPTPYTPADAEEYIANARVEHTAGTAVRLAITVDDATARAAIADNATARATTIDGPYAGAGRRPVGPSSGVEAPEAHRGDTIAEPADGDLYACSGTGPALAGSIDLRLGPGGGASIGYWVTSALWGRGIASAAARLQCDFGFETLGLRRIELNAAVDNLASRRVAEKAGFQLEGVRRAWQTVGGVPTDVALYARLADDADPAPADRR